MGSVTKFKETKNNNALFYLLIASAVLTLLFTSVNLAHTMPSRLDEGAFLIKGYYYWTGKYAPFEDFGPWTNNMPLAYYIPGFAQWAFGPGLQTGRYFSVFLTLLTFIALFLLAKRLTNKWWALLIILPLAINPALLMVYVQTISEGIVACLLSWALYFLIGEERKSWQIAAGAFLSALTILTRQNMIFLAPFVILYAFWLHGKKAGFLALGLLSAPLLAVHALFFPDIFKLWFTWLPGFVKQFFNFNTLPGGGAQRWRPEVDSFDRISSFFLTFRYYLISFLGILFSLVLLPIKKVWESEYERKLVLLSTLAFLVFFGMHAWASLGKNYCVFCLPNYVAFFIPLAVIVSVLSIRYALKSGNRISPVPSLFFLLFAIPGVLLGSLETTGRQIMELPFPRIRDGRLITGSTQLWTILRNRFGLEYDPLLRIIPPSVGLLLAVFIIILSASLFFFLRKRSQISFGKLLMIEILVLIIVLTPTSLIGRDNFGNTCNGDVLGAYETIGKQLQDVIPSGGSVYWNGGSVITPLVYIPDAGIHPPQLNGIYSFRDGGDRTLLERDGFYNGDSINDWRKTDDYFIVSNANIRASQVEFFDPDVFHEYQKTSPIDPCNENSFFRIFVRK